MTLLAVILMEPICGQYVMILHSLVSILIMVSRECKIGKNGNGIYRRDEASLGAAEHIKNQRTCKKRQKRLMTSMSSLEHWRRWHSTSASLRALLGNRFTTVTCEL